jgi:ABC-type transport system substrate-binding protein
MKPIVSRWIAAASALAVLGAIAESIQAARRPRYGGELRVETHAADPSETLFAGSVFETLVRFDDHGDPQPWLATAWAHDPARKVWVFTPRPHIVLHNGEVWSPAPIEFSDEQPIENILSEAARAKNAIMIRTSNGAMIGTGPLRIARWENGKFATLEAHESYWGGRPYLDSVDVRLSRDYADQAADFQLGKADVIESPGKKSAAPLTEVLVLSFEARVPEAVREAVALSIDRAAIHSVILQRQGEASGALLPQWLSGYSFLFATERNLSRARQLITAASSPSFSYDPKDPVLRPVAQRIEVNVREAGITLHATQGPGDLTLVRLPVASTDPLVALEDMAAVLKLPLSSAKAYDAERMLLDGYRVIPIVHLPKSWTVSPRVRNWPRLADVWLE